MPPLDTTPAHQAVDALAAEHDAQEATWAAERDRLLARIAELEHPAPAQRFPGDPGPGRIVLGVAPRNGSLARTTMHEKAGGKPMARRRYWNDGIIDLRDGGPVRAAILEDHRAGRRPVVSVKPGVDATAAGQHDDELRRFAEFVEGLDHEADLIVHHEPENDRIGSAAYAAAFRTCQQRIRGAILDVTGGAPTRRLTFGGSLMAYTWTPEARNKGLRAPQEWWPGAGVWDWCGLDQYAQKAGTAILDQKWKDACATLAGWGVPLAVTELGIRSSDPDSGNKLRALYEDAVARGAVFLHYYDNDANSTGEGWVMTGAQLDAWHALIRDPRTANAWPA